MKETDIDIDVADRSLLLDKLKHIVARIDRDDGFEKHKTGVYFQDIPHDPVTNIATIDHTYSTALGFFKLDFLNVSIYKDVKDEDHLNELVNTEPIWELLEIEDFVKQLFHIGRYHSLLVKLKPKSIEDLAMILAIIRPAKSYLRDQSWDRIRKEVWTKPEDGSYHFKRSHSFGYAMAIVVHMNLLTEKYINGKN